MMILLTGGSKCGKSGIAETILSDFTGLKFYIATMQPYGRDAREAIARHHKMREGKGFSTIERYTDLAGLTLPQECGILLECMGNLCANEMFAKDGISDPIPAILRGISHLRKIAGLLVIVTNEVGADGIRYSPETMQYIRNLGIINKKLAERSDVVIECVAGIPLIRKGEKPCCIP